MSRNSFEHEHAAFMARHLRERTGERRGRLERGHNHAETLMLRNVWYPLRGDFTDLHPEYEVLDWRGRSYFADFAWLPGYVRLLIEVKGFATHVAEMDRQKFSKEINRETFLQSMGYRIISFAYDDVERNPELCQSLLRLILGQFQPTPPHLSKVTPVEKELLRLVLQRAETVRPKDIADYLEVNVRTAVALLSKLCEKGWLVPSMRGAGQRIVRYELIRGAVNYLDL